MNTQSKVFKGNGKEIITWNAVKYFQASIIGNAGNGFGKCTTDCVRFSTRKEADAYAMSETGTDAEVSRHGWTTDEQIETAQEN